MCREWGEWDTGEHLNTSEKKMSAAYLSTLALWASLCEPTAFMSKQNLLQNACT